jgi:hypothetical protein
MLTIIQDAIDYARDTLIDEFGYDIDDSDIEPTFNRVKDILNIILVK